MGDQGAFWILVAALTLAPLPFGSRDPVTVAVWCGWLGLGVAWAPVQRFRPPHYGVLAGVALLLLGYAVVLHEQLSSRPWFSDLDRAWAETAALLGSPVSPYAAAVRWEPLFALGTPLACVLALVLALSVGADRRDARRLLRATAWAGVAYAAYGIVALALFPGSILWREKTFYVGNLTGTFVNRNTAATYFGSCTLLWFLFLLEDVRRRWADRPRGWHDALFAGIWGETGARRPVPTSLWATALCLVATLLTASRAGSVLTLLTLVLATVVFFRRRFCGVGRATLVTVAALLCAVVVLQSLGGGVGARFEAHGLSDEGRLSAWRSTLRMIADHPWIGRGLGAFTYVFPGYRDIELSPWGIWNAAHSTPLEIASEVGVPLATAVALGWIGGVAVLARGSLVRRRDRMLPLAGLCVGVLAGLHTSIDFSLQVPGCAIVVFGVFGVGLAQAFAERDRADDARGIVRPEVTGTPVSSSEAATRPAYSRSASVPL
ncbi:O-antigen ligase family protein [Rhodoplanes roseus]|uniref:O-antigen ligase-related domain-containing protein n=1 Tax=Rhodoplanes roseus TaxID=29409 RepID=A0A327KTS4_9BRAD|nr:O-antigen ligase family protein [Rhodoplanes roseus]RAI42229.1 hypothetical protein CH341_20015 [Rhodoplanes roseus]